MRNSRSLEIFPISLRDVEVRSIADITPHLRRIVFGGEQLAGYTVGDFSVPPFASVGFDDDIRIVFPDPETGQRPAPGVLGTGTLSWPAEIKDLFRTYTVRAFDEQAQLLTVDFARHTAGVAENWCAQAQVGDRVYVVGPKMSHSLPTHLDALVLVGDETAVPAIGRALEEAGDAPVNALLWAREGSHFYPLAHGANADVTWLSAAEGADLAEAFASVLETLVGRGIDPSRIYVWIAGEAGENKALRAVAKQAGIEKTNLEVTGYWRAGGATTAGPANGGVLARLRDLISIDEQLIFRAALALNLFPELSSTPRPLGEVADAIGVPAGNLTRLARALNAMGLVAYSVGQDDAPATLATTPMSRELSDADSRLAELFSSPSTVEEIALAALPAALRGGGPVALPGWGMSAAELIDSSPQLRHRAQAHTHTRASWVAPAVADALQHLIAGATHVVLHGPGCGVYADDIIRKLPDISVALMGAGEEELTAVDPSRRGHLTAVAAPDGPVILLIDPFTTMAAADLQGLLRDIAAGQEDPTVLIACDLVEDSGGDGHTYFADLVALAARGASIPTAGDVARLLVDAGFVVSSARHVGWGKQLISARRA